MNYEQTCLQKKKKKHENWKTKKLKLNIVIAHRLGNGINISLVL